MDIAKVGGLIASVEIAAIGVVSFATGANLLSAPPALLLSFANTTVAGMASCVGVMITDTLRQRHNKLDPRRSEPPVLDAIMEKFRFDAQSAAFPQKAMPAAASKLLARREAILPSVDTSPTRAPKTAYPITKGRPGAV